MADIDKIKVGDTTYDVKDATARNSLIAKVNITDIDDNLTSLSVTHPLSARQGNIIRKKVISNMLKSELETTTLNGITCTNNGDGTYTLNGTASANASFYVNSFNFESGKELRLVGCPSGGSSSTYRIDVPNSSSTIGSSVVDVGNGVRFTPTSSATLIVRIIVYSGQTLSNKIFKPMICYDTSATYDDFVSYNNSFTYNDNSNSSNTNLLDNPFFTINQRGFTSATYASKTYCFDRWNGRYGTFTAVSNGVTFSWNGSTSDGAILQQVLEDSLSGNFTMSISIDGTIYSTILTVGSSTNYQQLGNTTIYVDINNGGGETTYVNIKNKSTTSVTINSVKLEKGSISTLSMDVAPNYATELLKCQRYYYVQTSESGSGGLLGVFRAINSSDCRGILYLPTRMRTRPTVTVSNCALMPQGSTTSQSISSYDVWTYGNHVQLRFYGHSSFSTNMMIELYAINTSGKIIFSADL